MTNPHNPTMDCTIVIVLKVSPMDIPKDSFTNQNPPWLT